jgi:UDP-N-acetylglucosamine 4-epimerase
MSGRFRNTRRKGRKQSRKQQGGNFDRYEGLTILVTGGAGFIGSNLVDALLEAGAAKVRVLDNFITGKDSNLDHARTFGERFELMRGDIRNLDQCKAACKDANIVFHEAAMVSVPMSMEKPLENHETNITGTLNMLIAAAEAGVKRFVYASSAATYGMDETLPKVETMTRHYPSPYALSKGVDEDYAKLWAYKEELGKGMTTVGLRYFNVYGPRQDPKSPYSGVISIFADKIKNNKPLLVFGDGSNTRDFVFVKDIVQGNMLAGLAKLGSNEARVYNVGTGSAVSLLELKETMERIYKQTVEVEKMPARPGDILHSRSDITAIRTDLGYAPAYTLEEGLSILLLGE